MLLEQEKKATDKEEALDLLFGKLKKKKIPVTEKRIMKCKETRQLSARNKKHIHNLKGTFHSLTNSHKY